MVNVAFNFLFYFIRKYVCWLKLSYAAQAFKGYKLLTFVYALEVYALETTHLYISSKIEGFSYEG